MANKTMTVFLVINVDCTPKLINKPISDLSFGSTRSDALTDKR